ncbi:MAG TPA: hypothetical protein VFP19_00020, partial [Candidatus Limnocylindrales bacterium]|nr:hypothetical protein [Candidatus Limnocylindrales bacterium]
MTRVWVAALLLRRLRAERGVLAILFVLIAATAFAFSAGPRLFNRVADAGLAYAMQSALPIQRDLTLALSYSIPPGSDGGVAALEAYGQRQEATFPADVERQIAGRSLHVSLTRLLLTDPPLGPTHLVLRYQDGMTDATRLVAGRWPVGRGMPLAPSSGNDQAPPAVVEVAFSSFEADQLGVKIGDRFGISPDASDPLARTVIGPSDLFGSGRHDLAPAVIEVVGLFEPVDPGAPDWAGDGGLLQATVTGIDPPFTYYATAFVAAAAYPDLAGSQLLFRYEWHYRIDPQLDAGQAVALG